MLRRIVLVLLACSAMASTAAAATIVFTDRVTWLAAVANPVTTIDFEGIAPAGGSSPATADLVIGGTHFGRATVSDPGVGTFISNWGSGATLFSYATTEPGVVTLASPMNAFGFDYGATACFFVTPCPAGGVSVTLSNGAIVSGASPQTTLRFLGVVSTDPITSASLRISPTFGIVDNVSFGNTRATPVPEPSTPLLLVGAIAGWMRRRRAAHGPARVRGSRFNVHSEP